MNPFVFILFQLALLLGAGAGIALGWDFLDNDLTDRAKRPLRWIGGFCGAWFVVLGVVGAGHDGPVIHACIGSTFSGLLVLSSLYGPTTASIIRGAGVLGNIVLLVNGLILAVALSGVLHSVGIDVAFGSVAMFAMLPVGLFAAIRLQGLYNMAPR